MYDRYDQSDSIGSRFVVWILKKLMWASIGLVIILWLVSRSGIPVGTELAMITHPVGTVQSEFTHEMTSITTIN